MKILTIATFTILLCSCSSKEAVKKDNTSRLLLAQQDSGYISKQEGLPFMLAESLADTAGFDHVWELISETDTIGKYYKLSNGEGYMACLMSYVTGDIFETEVLMELSQSGELVRSERFLHGQYACCWPNRYDGFRRYGEWFGITTCASGPGYCSGYLNLFKELIPQNEQTNIPLGYYYFFIGEGQVFSSTMEWTTDGGLTMHYTLEEGKLTEADEFKPASTKQFDIRYAPQNNRWVTADSAVFDKYQLTL